MAMKRAARRMERLRQEARNSASSRLTTMNHGESGRAGMNPSTGRAPVVHRLRLPLPAQDRHHRQGGGTAEGDTQFQARIPAVAKLVEKEDVIPVPGHQHVSMVRLEEGDFVIRG